MRIFIPTKGRSEQLTWDILPSEVLEKYRAVLVTQDDRDYELLVKKGFPCLYAPVKGISATRQWILDYSDDDKVVMLDDDLSNWASRSRLAGEARYVKADYREIIDVFDQLDRLLTTHAHAAIGHRQFANAKPDIEFGGRALRALGYRKDIMDLEKIKFTLPLMEDFEVTLKLFRAGYPNAVIYDVVQDQPGSDRPGGCKDWRTLERHNAAAEALAAMFPRFVKLKDVEGWDIGTRKDVSIQWKKALNDE
jgi:hypothetical protein